MNKPQLRIFLADDHVIVRDGIKALINAQADMLVVGEASDGNTALNLCRELQPDVIIMDISMPGTNGVDATCSLKELCPHSRTLALTVHESTAYLRQMLQAGAAGYVLKRAASEELIHGIRSVAKGGTYIDPMIADRLAEVVRGTSKVGGAAGVTLSERELDVVKMVAQGYSGKEIAKALNISAKSVETYKARAMQKLGLVSRSELVRYAVGQKWLS